MWVKGEIFCLALQILKNQVNSVSMKTIIRSLSIIFVIHIHRFA